MTDTRQTRGRRPGRLARFAAPLGLATAAALGLTMATPLTASAAFQRDPYDHYEAFTGSSFDAKSWYSSAGTKGTGFACLTGATGEKGPLKACADGTPDPEGKGALRLTSNKPNQNGFIVTRDPIPADRGLSLTLDYASYDAKGGRGADGLAVMLLDGAEALPTDAGLYGSGLGYNGIKGGYLGVGIDSYGNFLKNLGGFPGQAQGKPNSITVRGATSQNNQVISTYPSTRKLDVADAKERSGAVRSVRVDLSTAGRLSVAVDFHDGDGFQNKIDNFDLNSIPGQPKLPKDIRIGFAASTGDAVENHDVWNVKATTLPDRLTSTVDPAGPITADGESTFNLNVSNDPAAGSTDGPRTSEVTFPKGITPTEAGGNGWDCKVDGQKVSCTHPGTGPDALAPGKTWPPAPIKAKVATDADGEYTITSTVEGPDGKQGAPTEDTVKVTLKKGPALTSKMTADAPVTAGENAAFTVKTSNAADAGPTNGPVTVTRTFPAGITPVTAAGPGWDCSIKGQTVSCTRPGKGPDMLNPGDSYPDIHIAAIVDKDVKGGDAPVTGTTDTPRNSGGDGRTDEKFPVKPAPALPPSLAVNTAPVGDLIVGKPGKFAITVDNAATAGPTTGEVTVTRDFGPGITPVKASGDGWKCSVTGQRVTCVRPGNGADALQPGKAYPPINVDVKVGDKAGPVPGTTAVTTEGSDLNGTSVKDTAVVKEDASQDISCGAYIQNNRALCAGR
ncbi:hypothetical protein AB0J38_44605 [Streptomyces sp. NPDC050095]|uniref:lectin-like domain-containing protein n=1 Tax=unclassified Streptomyces TaxID=2593676 RepID=UPI00344886CC